MSPFGSLSYRLLADTGERDDDDSDEGFDWGPV